MFSSINTVLICFTSIVIHFATCLVDIPQPPSLTIYTPGEPDHTDVLVKRVNDNLTLVCELHGDTGPRVYVWNYVGGDRKAQPFQVDTSGPAVISTLTKQTLQLADSGHYMCSVPPFSVSKYILVQTRGPQQCARGAFWCGNHCVLSMYVCDGFRDCLNNEDEAPELCDFQPCSRPDKLNCSSGRCISEAACCRARGPLCRQPSCCDEHPRYSRLEGLDAEYPPLFEDRHAPDDYGFIQSTIYTVTACALIFMIAVVLLVSAICKMHMKRAALRSYTRAHHHTSQHYSVHYAQAHRFPPCYEASRLLEQERNNPASPLHSPAGSPARQPLQCSTECPPDAGGAEAGEPAREECATSGFGLARLSAIFTSRYRQVPTHCLDVEMSDVRSASLQSSPTRNPTRARLDNYRSPTYCDLNADFIFTNPDTPTCGRDLNYMATPVEFYRRRTFRGNLDRVIENLNRPRPLTLQLGRFQLSIPRLGRRASLDRRPDTPNVAELNIDDLDFVRLNSNETYTLNGRTIRLLGANFENYPILSDSGTRPPPYTEAMRYKLYGPPPEYLSRDGLNDRDSTIVSTNEQQARNNIEMPPNYEELASGGGNNNNILVSDNANSGNISVNGDLSNGNISVNGNLSNGNVSNLDVNNSATENAVNNNAGDANNVSSNDAINNVTDTQLATRNNTNNVTDTHLAARNNTNNVTDTHLAARNNTNNVTDTQIAVVNNGNEDDPPSDGMETLNSVLDNLPAIDSDVNANDNDIRFVN